MLHVPLFIRFPDQEVEGTVTRRVGLIDLFPTLLEHIGVAIPSSVQGREVLPPTDGRDRTIAALNVIRTDRWTYFRLHGGQRFLFDHWDDPQETRNVVDARPVVAGQLSDWLRSQQRENQLLNARLAGTRPQ